MNIKHEFEHFKRFDEIYKYKMHYPLHNTYTQ